MSIELDAKDRVALVTGAAKGIGESTALRLSEAGHKILAADVDEAGLADTVAEISAAGGEAVSARTDIGDPEQVEAMVDLALTTYGRLDVAVNNAAIPQRYQLDSPGSSLIDEMGLDEWHELVRINLNGCFYCTRYEVRAMKSNAEGGSIVNVSSSGAALSLEGMAGYCATKQGVLGLTESAAIEFAPDRIRVNAVLPGRVRTKMNVDTMRDSDPEAERRLDATAPLNRAGEPMELADAIVWLCSDLSSYVTGHSLVVDGGTTIRHPRSGWR